MADKMSGVWIETSASDSLGPTWMLHWDDSHGLYARIVKTRDSRPSLSLMPWRTPQLDNVNVHRMHTRINIYLL